MTGGRSIPVFVNGQAIGLTSGTPRIIPELLPKSEVNKRKLIKVPVESAKRPIGQDRAGETISPTCSKNRVTGAFLQLTLPILRKTT